MGLLMPCVSPTTSTTFQDPCAMCGGPGAVSAPRTCSGTSLESSLFTTTSGAVVREEGRRGYHSSFYYLTTNYPLGRLKEAAAHLTRDGWDVGLHGDFGTHDSLEEMKRSLERFSEALGFKPRGVREHFLKFDFSKTWDVVSAAGFDYDTTVGNNDRLGFKIGLATPFHPPDAGWRASRTLEIPLTLMDTTLWGYLKKDEESGLAEIKRMVEKVREVERAIHSPVAPGGSKDEGGKAVLVAARLVHEGGVLRREWCRGRRLVDAKGDTSDRRRGKVELRRGCARAREPHAKNG